MAERGSFGFCVKKQTVLGTIATAPYVLLPVTAFRPGYSSNRVTNPTIRGTRFGVPGRSGATTVSPSIDFLMASGVYDVLLEAMFQNTFATDVLTQASTRQFLTGEDRQPDSTFFGLYRDLVPNEFTLRLAPGGFAECSMAFLGTTYTPSGTGSATPTAASTQEPFDAWTAAFSFAGSSTLVCTALELTMRNNIEARPRIGSKDPDRLVANLDAVTGSMTLSLADTARISDAINDTSRALSFTLNYSTQSQAWSIPITKTTGWDGPVSGDAERLQQINFECDVSGGTKVSVTRDLT